MTSTLLPGRPVLSSPVETPQEHVRNALQLLRGGCDGALTEADLIAAIARLERATQLLEGRVA